MDAHIPKGPRNKAALSVLRWASQNDCKLSFFFRKCSCVTNVRKPCTVVVLIFKTLQQVFTPSPSSPASSLVQILFFRPWVCRMSGWGRGIIWGLHAHWVGPLLFTLGIRLLLSSPRYGCCPDGLTRAKGLNFKGCDNATPCKDAKWGCCDDLMNPAHGEFKLI